MTTEVVNMLESKFPLFESSVICFYVGETVN
ncbi:hypothetical protein B0I21_101526 [Sphingobacterium paludis]|uniref:Uncharacterized protein n=1 Tax=Sphingobacterium paludis TaxID=1476465 RepID=A0A4R7DBU8_9SPHI|nr:hypothetical protein B0I21_101526 [Sphingobacterium paludis]